MSRGFMEKNLNKDDFMIQIVRFIYKILKISLNFSLRKERQTFIFNGLFLSLITLLTCISKWGQLYSFLQFTIIIYFTSLNKAMNFQFNASSLQQFFSALSTLHNQFSLTTEISSPLLSQSILSIYEKSVTTSDKAADKSKINYPLKWKRWYR